MLPLNKRALLPFLILFLISCGSGEKKDPNKLYFDKASEYNDYINKQFEEVNRLWNATLVQMDDSTLVYNTLDSLNQRTQLSYVNMNHLAEFKGDTTYKFAAGEYFKFMHTEANSRLKEAIEIGLMENVSDSLYFRFDEIGRQLGVERDLYIGRLKNAQLNFIRITAK